MIEIVFNDAQLRLWGQVGIERQVCRIGRPRFGGDNDPRKNAIGVYGEAAFAKWRGIYYDGNVGNLDYDGDVVPGIQIRTTEYATGHLLINPPDKDLHRFILARWIGHSVFLVGWVYGIEGKQHSDWEVYRTGGGCHRVHMDILRPIETLYGDAFEGAA